MNENPQKEDGYTPIANEIMEALARTNLTAHEWRVLLCVIRKTYGFQKKEDWIAVSQLSAGTGLHKAHVSRAKKLLAVRNIVTPRDNKIGLNKSYSQWKELPHGVNNHAAKKVTPRGIAVTPRGISELPHGADTKETLTKETIQKKHSASTKPKGPSPGVELVMGAMAECFGTLDDSRDKNRRYAWLLIQRAMKHGTGTTEQRAAEACAALIRATAKHDWWGSRIKKVETIYRNTQLIAEALRGGKSKVNIAKI